MDINIQSQWQEVLKILQNQIPDVSFKTWIEPLRLISCTNEFITLEVPSDFHTEILKSRYSDKLKNAIKRITYKEYDFYYTNTAKIDTSAPQKHIQSTSEPISESLLNPKFTFDNFVAGKSNRFAYMAACQVAMIPSNMFNPLFIFGDAGMGKTHLLHAIGHKIMDTHPETKVLFTSTDHFINDLIYFIKEDLRDGMIQKYGQADVWLIDNIQFLHDKERSQEEFFKIYNALLLKGKQIIMTCSTSPKDMSILGNRFSSVFDLGLIAYVEPLDFDTRVSILKKCCSDQDMNVPVDVIEYIARQTTSNYRELRLALNTVLTYAAMFEDQELDIEMAREALESQFI